MCGGLLIRNPNKIRVLRAALFHILRGNAHSPRVHFGLRSVIQTVPFQKCVCPKFPLRTFITHVRYKSSSISEDQFYKD